MALIKDILVMAPEARGITCPYTGHPIDVYMRVASGIVTYSAPYAVSLAVPHDSREELLRLAATRRGVQGPEHYAETCAYTNRKVTLRETPDGKFYMEGAFNPRMASMNREGFLKTLSCGAVNVSKPLQCKTVPEIQVGLDEDQKFDLSQDVQEMTEKAADQFVRGAGIDNSVKVSMATPSKKSCKRRTRG